MKSIANVAAYNDDDVDDDNDDDDSDDERNNNNNKKMRANEITEYGMRCLFYNLAGQCPYLLKIVLVCFRIVR
jgi:hypothetical protein